MLSTDLYELAERLDALEEDFLLDDNLRKRLNTLIGDISDNLDAFESTHCPDSFGGDFDEDYL